MRLNRSHETKTSPLGVALLPALLALTIGALAAAEAGANFDLTFTTTHQIKVGRTGFEFVRLKCVIENTGTDPDEYDILRLYQNMPAGWETSICLGGGDGGCYAPFVDSVYANTAPCDFPECASDSNFDLNPGETDTVSCYFTAAKGEGSGYSALRVRSVGDPTKFRDLRLGCVTDGVDVLIMDDDGGAGLQSYYEAAIPGGTDKGTWDRSIDGASSAELLNFPSVVWFTGSTIPTLVAEDRTALGAYLAGGGRLALSGQDIAFDLCDPASPNFSPANVTWYETNLKSRYLSNNSSSLSLLAVAGDPVSGGVNLAIQGGDGASNQTDPDVIQPRTAAATVWTYATGGGTAATRILGSGYRAVNLAFGFEAISSAANRATVMNNILNWIGTSLISVDDDADAAAVPAAFKLEPASPNPFGPSTAINFELARTGVARLRILDPAGRVVRVLADGALAAGRHLRGWDGRDTAGREMASGVYLAELIVEGSGGERVRLVLIR